MKKIIFAVATATILSGTIGIASAYDYNNTAKKAAKSASCTCADCACKDCNCPDCSNCNCCGSGNCCKK